MSKAKQPALDALHDAIEKYESIVARIESQRENIANWQSELKKVAADTTTDVSALTKQSVVLKSKISEAESEIEIIKTRLSIAADAIEPFLQPASSELRKLERQCEDEKVAAAKAILDDPKLLEYVAKLRAALHMIGDSHSVMNDLRLSNNFAGHSPEDFEKYGHKPDYPGGSHVIGRGNSIVSFNKRLKSGVKTVKAGGSLESRNYQEFA